MQWFGELESHIIKVQHNCVSDNKIYANQKFIPIDMSTFWYLKETKCGFII